MTDQRELVLNGTTPIDSAADENSHSRALLGKGSVYTVATAAQLAGALLVQPLLSRLLPRAEYGRAALAQVICALIALVFTLGLPAVITREYFRPGGSASTRVLVSLTVVAAVFLGGVAFATGPLWAAPFGGFDAPLALGALAGIALAVLMSAQAILRAEGQAGRFVCTVITNAVGGQLAGLAGIALFGATATHYVAGVTLGTVTGAVLSLVWAKPALRLPDGAKPAYRAWFRIALPTVPHAAALYLMMAGDRFVVHIQRGDSSVAAYTLALLASTLGITMAAAVNNAWAPIIYEAPEEQRWHILETTTRHMTQLAAIMAGLIAACAPLGLWLLADPSKYNIEALVPMVAITALATVPYVFYLASEQVLFWSGRTLGLLWITPLVVAVNLLCKALVLPWAGFVGAAVVTVTVYGLLALLVSLLRRPIAPIIWSGRVNAIAAATGICIAGAILPSNLYGYAARAVIVLGLLIYTAFFIRKLKFR